VETLSSESLHIGGVGGDGCEVEVGCGVEEVFTRGDVVTAYSLLIVVGRKYKTITDVHSVKILATITINRRSEIPLLLI